LNSLGKVYLVGFGPGDPELLTLKADRLLREADIIFYDNLLSTEHFDTYSAKKEYVGKRKGDHYKNQQEINEILLEASKQFKKIVRLKGGDPMIFGRVGEELQFLVERGIEVEIVPGISSANAAAASCLFPLTQREYSSSVAFCTGHPEDKIVLPKADTIVVYMGASSIQTILEKAVEDGWPLNTPIAIITNTSLPIQTQKYTSIRELQQGEIEVVSPSIIIIGKVVDLAK